MLYRESTKLSAEEHSLKATRCTRSAVLATRPPGKSGEIVLKTWSEPLYLTVTKADLNTRFPDALMNEIPLTFD